MSASPSEAAVRERVTEALRDRADDVADRWVQLQMDQAGIGTVLPEGELREEADALVAALLAGLETGAPVERVISSDRNLHQAVTELSLRRAMGGASPTDTSLAVLALKDALLETVRQSTQDAAELFAVALMVNRLLDAAGALSFAAYVEGREEIIQRQSRELLEQSTPVVQIWRHVLAVPLIGTLDTSRTQVVMENLLQSIKDNEAQVAIIDITGVAMVDTAVAQHLMQTVSAVRLMGADCIISGVRPSIAQTIAQLGIDLSTILTRATLADALAAAMQQTEHTVRASNTVAR
ncbi:STAS domain-containing protein [Streptomyces sp. TRM 70351]|uniref:STAS domain-containing protein n=1 Tax=Streptomyces sp. TRM 70351 TaxID=3116552 RepID=UPI002E7B653D|nr:STAS domain-containing protein [Streptomyces sp. TRM 70351]MEE1927949.1 STAS domain-containing protein [Streptomyces sp. TRM 70351]